MVHKLRVKQKNHGFFHRKSRDRDNPKELKAHKYCEDENAPDDGEFLQQMGVRVPKNITQKLSKRKDSTNRKDGNWDG
ncbi:MAG TPA: hypothetical protein VGK47_09295 [Nitrososphaeraceae archaeon]